MIKNVGHVRRPAVKYGAGGGGKVLYARKKIGGVIAKLTKQGVVTGSGKTNQPPGQGRKKRICKPAAAVGSVYGSQRRHIGSHTEPADGVPCIQTALGMRYNIDFFCAGLFQNTQDFLLQLLRTVCNGKRGLLPAVENRCAIAFQSVRYASPVIEALPIPKENAMYHNDRETGPAYAAFNPRRV